MKKSFLGLLALALAIVGCQNYDDQFDTLNSKINELTETVSSLSDIQDDISNLSTSLDNLKNTALDGDDLTSILAKIAEVSTAVDNIKETDISGIEAEVNDLDAEILDIQTKLKELLSQNAVINQNVRITSVPELELAQDLIATADDDPNVTIQGYLIVTTPGPGADLKGVYLDSLNMVLKKIKAVMKTVTVTSADALTISNLKYIDGDLSYNGGGTGTNGLGGADGSLTTITGGFDLTQNGALDYSKLNSVTNGIKINETAGTVTVTSANFVGLTAGTVYTDTNELVLPEATSVKISTVFPTTVTLAKATVLESTSTANQTATTIVMGGAAATISMAAGKLTGTVSISTTGGVTLSSVTEAVALQIEAADAISLPTISKLTGVTTLSSLQGDVSLSSLSEITAATSVSATAITLPALTKITSVVSITGPSTIVADALTQLHAGAGAQSLYAPDATTLSLESLSTATGTITPKAGATVHLKSLNDAAKLTTLANVVKLKLTEQTGAVSLVTAVGLVELDYTGKKAGTVAPGSQEAENSLKIIAANASLTTLSVAGHLGTLTVDNSTLKSLSTVNGSVIIKTDIKNNTALETFSLGHTYLTGDNALTISVTNNTDELFVALDMGTMEKVKHVNVTGNTSLTTITAPSASVLAEPLAVVTVTLDSNLVAGTWTDAVAGSETSSHTLATLTGVTATNFKAFYGAYKNQANRTAGTVTMSIEVDAATTKMAADNVAQAAGPYQQLIGANGKIDDEAEHLLLPN